MTESSRMPLFDLRKLNAALPVPRLEDPAFKVLVVGAKDDFIVVSAFKVLFVRAKYLRCSGSNV